MTDEPKTTAKPAPKKSKKPAAGTSARELLQAALDKMIDEKPGDASELDRRYYNAIEELKRVIAMTNSFYL